MTHPAGEVVSEKTAKSSVCVSLRQKEPHYCSCKSQHGAFLEVCAAILRE